jgi:hypothetical protein
VFRASVLMDSLFWLVAWLGFVWATISSAWMVLNSQFVASLFAALFGALAGAYGAQRIVERSKRRSDLITEIRNTNAAIMLAFDTTNAYLNLKDQHVVRLKRDFEAARAGALAARQKKSGRYGFTADFQTLQEMVTSIDLLRNLVFDKVSLTGRPLVCISALVRCAHELNETIGHRNRWIAEFRKAFGGRSANETVVLYFGFRDEAGHLDETYPALISATHRYTNDCIFFGQLLCTDLVKHGKSLAKELGQDAPRVAEPDFAKARANGLIPSDSEYKSWLNAFQKSE